MEAELYLNVYFLPRRMVQQQQSGANYQNAQAVQQLERAIRNLTEAFLYNAPGLDLTGTPGEDFVIPHEVEWEEETVWQYLQSRSSGKDGCSKEALMDKFFLRTRKSA